MQLDAYLYLTGIVNIAPFVQVLIATSLIVIIYIVVKRGIISASLSKESSILLFCFLIYISVQILGIIAWKTMPSDTTVLLYWVYMIMLLLLGGMSGVLIGDRVPYVLVTILIFLTLVTVIDALSGGINVSARLGRTASTLRNPNIASFVMVILMLGAFRWQRLGLIEVLSIIIAGVGITLTQSRGGLLAYVTAVVCFSIWWASLARNSNIRAKRILVAGLIGLLVISVVTLMLFANRYGLDGTNYMSYAVFFDTPGRDVGFQIALGLIRDRPLVGHGTGFVYTQDLGPHNMFLRALVENGLLGLFAICMVFLGFLRFGVARRDKGMLTLAIVLIVMSMSTHNLTEARSILIVIGMLFADSSRKRKLKMNFIPNYKRRIVLS